MLVNLSDVLASEGMRIEREVPLEMTSFGNGQGDFRIKEKSPVSFTFENAGNGKARVRGSASLKLLTNCSRCLGEVPLPLDLVFDRMVISPQAGWEDEEADDLSFMDGSQLDVEAFVHNEILVNWPTKILCKEDCKGLCPVCGQDLNAGDCGCDTFVPDPRMAAIQDIFNAKEV